MLKYLLIQSGVESNRTPRFNMKKNKTEPITLNISNLLSKNLIKNEH